MGKTVWNKIRANALVLYHPEAPNNPKNITHMFKMVCKKKNVCLIIVCLLLQFMMMPAAQSQSTSTEPLRVAVAGITHGHVPLILGRKGKTDVTIVGIYEPNVELAQRYAKTYNFSTSLLYTDLNKMLDAVKPEAVAAFGSIYEHMAAVEACAPRGIHVMVEKPLATNNEHANRMKELAKKNNIYLLTNYETSWYPSTEKTYQLVRDSNYVGNIKKVVFHHGHEGPKEIGVSKEFLNWLTDPLQNGGGALIDFGCYGANIMTYLMQGQEPVSVTAVTQNFKPAVYPKVMMKLLLSLLIQLHNVSSRLHGTGRLAERIWKYMEKQATLLLSITITCV
jgi:predicted dehydrogenase